ncbi:unnamed protein product [Trifolium pratense]|uniref:Uncharacterized protein n=1 Tax=Trifolium pratense TaxID=57577 RepID=A0ACB0L959_TRIPR|nr:unnamed protein product [Trifolium pratense]
MLPRKCSDCKKTFILPTSCVVCPLCLQDDNFMAMTETQFLNQRGDKLYRKPRHPGRIIETAFLSGVKLPRGTYVPNILHNSSLSGIQLEAAVHICQRHTQKIGNGATAGFLLGDGTGVGKGRTIAGVIRENWSHGRKKSLWISSNSILNLDVRRDLDDVGASSISVHPLNTLSYDELGITEGVIFLTYSCLIASNKNDVTRMGQLLKWCGTGFDGLIIFDESQKGKNSNPKMGKPTKAAEAVCNIQIKLPNARVVYSSATGASEPRDMGYMVRLGLWGDGTCFPDFGAFIDNIEKGDVGALELVAMDMKARGMYISRTLSYEGANVAIVVAVLNDKMIV